MLKLTSKVHLIDNVTSFVFGSTEPLTWTAGQYIEVKLPHDNPDGEGIKRWFTISSAPYEGIIQITTRVTGSTFKQALDRLPVGGELNLAAAPDGDFTWTETEKPLVWVAGGIGITPYHSILKQRHHDGLPLPLTLIYSNRNEQITFKDELDGWAAEHPELKVHYLVGQPLITSSLQQAAPELSQSLIYVSGPESMVETLENELEAAGIPKDQFKGDFFPNYTETNY